MTLMTELYPIENESIRSFLIRLAVANDYELSNRIFREFQDTKAINMTSTEDSLVTFACQLTNTCTVESFAPVQQSTHEGGKQLGHNAITQRTPQVCPDCMIQQSHTDAHWQLYPITHCHKHHKGLISHCPCCGEALRWDEDLLNFGCSHCDTPWHEIAAIMPQGKVPNFIEHFHGLSGDKRADYLEDLLTAAMRALRPYDSVHHGIKQLPHLNLDWEKLCSQGYALLTDKSFIEQWCQSLIDQRQTYAVISSGAVFYPLKTMQETLKLQWLVHAFNPTLANTSPTNNLLMCHDITPCNARNKAVSSLNQVEANQQLIHHIDQNAFAHLLGGDVTLARALFKVPSISSVTPVGRGRYSFIDIRDFIEQTKAQCVAKSYETVKLEQVSDLLDVYMLSPEEIVVEIYQYKLPIFIDRAAEKLLDAIMISEDVLMNHLETVHLQSSSVISLTRASSILKLPRHRVKRLGAIGLLKEVTVKPFTHDYTGASVAAFLTNYICIEQWASQHHLSEQKVINTLQVKGVLAAMSPFIYLRTPVLENILHEQTNYAWQIQEQLELFLEAA
ncbi:TniQ family protein [Thalassotalea sp. PP2-459]|uniref:TniQ family protein n=1 Tax=Thalassotalea sp. PP2-459 TaxID=1742724 RepID=UPI0009457E54|nr:TniQ family protein [Thalassotalea sp. PP2-459]OKY25124.1 hypothetical protein BI291_03675 [Thalassotalea sp. PP2-459]